MRHWVLGRVVQELLRQAASHAGASGAARSRALRAGVAAAIARQAAPRRAAAAGGSVAADALHAGVAAALGGGGAKARSQGLQQGKWVEVNKCSPPAASPKLEPERQD